MRHTIIQHFINKLSFFARSESGMTLPLLALSLVALTGFTGLAIDVGRVQMVQSKLQFSVDAAGLAAGATVSTASTENEFTKYLYTNFGCQSAGSGTGCYMGASLTGHSVTSNNTNTVFNLSATAIVPTTFMAVLGIHSVTLTADSEITRAITGLELILVLDVTGSMNQSAGGTVTKLAALKTAANTLIDTLFGGVTTADNDKLWIGIVPFSQGVNIGSSHTAWIDPNYTYDSTPENTANLDWGTTTWAGCVDSRLNGLDVTETPPSSGNTLFGKYYWTSDNLNTNSWASGNNNWKLRNYTKCVYTSYWCQSSGCPTSCSTTTSCGSSYASCTFNGTYSYVSPLNATNKGPNLYCPPEVTRMTNTSTTLKSAINSLTAQGNTEINTGLVWGWRMISPLWRGLWGGSMGTTLALDYGTKGMAKAVVLFTDGKNTISNSAHGSYWYTGSGRTGATSNTAAISRLDSKTLAICTAMKNAGIYVYTIGLGSSSEINANLLRNCATAENYYFYSPTTAELQGVFNSIGDSLSNLRVSQ